MPPSATHDQRFLVVRTDRLGDVLLTLPMLTRIRTSRPGCHITMLVRHYPGVLLTGHPDLDDLLWYDAPDGALVPSEIMLNRIRAGRFDVVLLVHPTPRLAWLMARAGIPVRVGTGYRYYSLLFTRKVFDHRRRGDRHELEYNLRLLAPLGIPADPPGVPVPFRLALPDAARLSARNKLAALGVPSDREWVIVHPGSGGSSRDWPAGKYAAFIREITRTGAIVLVTGGDAEHELVAGIVAAAGNEAFNVAGRLSLQELASVMDTSALFVGNSSGPLHLAVAMGTAVVGLYPQIPGIGPRRWGPYDPRARVIVPEKPETCRGCRGRGRRPCACMESIEPSTVLQAALAVMVKRTTISAGGQP